jgi:hypothetical protein
MRCRVNVFNCHPDSDTGNLVTKPLSSNGRPLRFRYSGFQGQATLYSPAGSVPPVSHLTSYTPTKSNLYFDISSATVRSEPALYRLLTFHVPNLTSLFLSLGRLSEESVQVRGPLWHFVKSLFLRREVVSPTPKPQLGGPSFFGCPRLRIQYSRGYLPYLEAVSSIRNLRTRHAVVRKGPRNMVLYTRVYFSLDQVSLS